MLHYSFPLCQGESQPSSLSLLPLFAFFHNYSWCLYYENTPDACFFAQLYAVFLNSEGMFYQSAGVVLHHELPAAPCCPLQNKRSIKRIR